MDRCNHITLAEFIQEVHERPLRLTQLTALFARACFVVKEVSQASLLHTRPKGRLITGLYNLLLVYVLIDDT